MARVNLNDLQVFRVVAKERSFTRAAAQLGVSASAVSQVMRNLEARLGVRLLTRTTRNVAPTEAGERLRQSLGPAFDQIDATLAGLSEFREKPSGTIRITAGEHPAEYVLWPVLRSLLQQYPDLIVDIDISNTLKELVAGRYDAGIRLGDQVPKDMVAVRISPDMSLTVVGAPSYLARHGIPKSPADLQRHLCINLRLPTHDSIYAWEFKRGKREMRVHVNGPLVVTRSEMIRDAALAGLGLAYLFENQVASDVDAGRLVNVLADWCPTDPGYHLYYPSNRQLTPAFSVLLDALRHKY